ncbi:recombination protein NinB, partial [Pseudomonas aeruginosa]
MGRKLWLAFPVIAGRRLAVANPRFHLRNETDRQRAIAILQRVDLTEGKTWSLHDEARSDAQNRRMWAMLRDI